MPRTITKTALIQVRLTEEELEKIRKAAATDGRTLSSWVRWQLAKEVTAQRVLTGP